jgi:hypothetical protein
MRRSARSIVTLALVIAGALVAAPGVAAAGEGAPLLRSGLVGSSPDGPILFGVKPGGRPWVIDEGRADVSRAGVVEVEVEGLVIPTPPQNGTNPVPALAASVVCNGTVAATTSTVPFSPAGDAQIEAHVTLPSPCLAPAVLLNPNGAAGTYIAATG